jgi:hypothetical protein
MDRNFTTIAMMIGSKGNEFEIVWETDHKISHENKKKKYTHTGRGNNGTDR